MKTIGFISDIHGNLAALEAVLADLRSRLVAATYCLGDLVGYGPDPNGVIDVIRVAGIPTVVGNYDDGVAFERGDCGCFYPDEEAKRVGQASYEFTVKTVTPERKEFLRSLPGEMYVEVEGTKIHLVHGSPRRINEYLLSARESRTFERIAAAEKADVLVFGHTHEPWHRLYGGVLFVNVGSVGRPKDGDPRAAYSLLHLREGREREVEDVRVVYDLEQTASGIIEAGLPPELAFQIRHGQAPPSARGATPSSR